MAAFNPNDMAGRDSGIFGLPYTRAESSLVLLPVPWEATTSYGDGTSRGPEAILAASRQIDLFDIETGDLYRYGYFLESFAPQIRDLNQRAKAAASRRVALLEVDSGDGTDDEAKRLAREVNQASDELNDWVYKQTKQNLREGKLVGIIGGDHSSPYGALQAISEEHRGQFGILHVDAHADLRVAYQGFTHSHASIMYNVMTSPFRPQNLVQVGIRDFSSDEYAYIRDHANQGVQTFFDRFAKRRLHRGETWQALCEEIIAGLPQKVYVSFDIDGLSPELCPRTGTPVPGGLDFDQALTLLASVVESGRQIVGFDLCEVTDSEMSGVKYADEWDANVGARILYKLCGWTLLSNGLKPSGPMRGTSASAKKSPGTL